MKTAAHAASARKARYRARLRRAEQIAPVSVSPAVVGALLDLGWLRPEASEDRGQIGAAIARMLGELARTGGGEK